MPDRRAPRPLQSFGVFGDDVLTALVRSLLDELDAELRDYALDGIEWTRE